MSTPAPTERDAAAAFELLAGAEESPPVLAVLTDEELLAIDGIEQPQVADTPFTDRDDVDAAAYASAAFRSLIARGLVVIADDAQETEGELLTGGTERRALQLDRTLAGITALRRGPLGVLSAHRQVADQLTELLVYVFPAGGILEELVTVDGFHHFSLPVRSAVPERLAVYLDPQGAADQDATVFSGTLEDLQQDAGIVARLDDARAITVLAGTGAGGRFQHTVFTASSAVYDLDTGGGEPARDVELVSLSPVGLRDLLAALVPEPVTSA